MMNQDGLRHWGETGIRMIVLMLLLGPGCARPPKLQRPTINELYIQAMNAAQDYPERSPLPSLSGQVPAGELPPQPASPVNFPAPVPPATLPENLVPFIESSRSNNSNTGMASRGLDDPRNGTSSQQIRQLGMESPAEEPIPSPVEALPVSRPLPVAPRNQNSKLVNLVFDQNNLREALGEIETQTGVSMIIDEQVDGRVTTTLENATVEEALRKILLPLGMVFRERNGQYFIGTTDPKSNLYQYIAESHEYQPRYLSPAELISLLPDRTKPYLRQVEKRNVIIVEAPADLAREILGRLRQSDQAVPQVVLEALVCVISPDKKFSYGFDWNHMVKIDGIESLNVGLSGLAFNGAGTPRGATNPFSDFAVTSAFVKLLAQEGYLTIRAAPRVMAKDGEKAEISIARETYFSATNTSSTGQFLFQPNIQKVEAGISMLLTPVIRGDNITVTIEKAEVSEDLRTLDTRPELTNNPYPVINRRKVHTTVEVNDGKTIVIGGLVQRQMVDRLSKIPVLGDIPYAGKLFQVIEKQEQDAEVVIFISPRIVRPRTTPAYDSIPMPETGPFPNSR